MAEISKQALKVDNNQSFPNNNNGAITPSILRAFNTNMIDSMVDEIGYNVDSGSWNNSISALNAYTASDNSAITNLNAFTASQLTINTGYNTFTQSANTQLTNLSTSQSIDNTKWNTLGTQSGSWVTSAITASSLITASFSGQTLTFTKGNGTTFGIVIPDVSGSDITALNAFTASQLTINTGYNTYTSSTNSRLTNIETTTASLNSSVTQLNANTASQQSQINSLISATASYAISSSVAAVDAAQQSQINSLISATGSYITTPLTSLNAYTQSNDTKWSNLGGQTGSFITESETASFARTNVDNNFSVNQTFTNITATSASITYLTTLYETSSVIYSSGSNQFGDELSDIQTLSGSVKVQGSLTVNGTPVLTSSVDISGLTTTASFNAYTQSNNQRVSSLETNSASVNTSITNINSATASLFTSASLALVTASFDTGTRNLTFTKGDTNTFSVNIPDVSGSTINTGSLVTTSSFNAYTQSNDQRVSSLETNSASVNASISNINQFTQSAQISINALNSATSSYATSAITASSLITASVSLNTITFTKGDASTFAITVNTGSGGVATLPSGLLSSSVTNFVDYSASVDTRINNIVTGTGFATTGSNTFTGNQTISTAGNTQLNLIAQPGFQTNVQFQSENSNFQAYGDFNINNNGQFGGSGSIKMLVKDNQIIMAASQGFQMGVTNAVGNGIEGGNITINVPSGSQQLQLTGSLNVQNTFTASLQEGYAWVGNAAGISTLVATSSFGGGASINTGSFATTGSNTFTGDQTLTDASGNTVTLTDGSGSLILVAKSFTSASAHLSSSVNQVNLIFKNNSNTADTIISGSGNMFINPAATTAGFKRYVGGSGNIALNGSNVAQISSSMAFSPTMNNNYFGGNGVGLIMRGPVSASSWTIAANNVLGTINIGSSAALNAEKLTGVLTMTGNSIQGGSLTLVANQSFLSGSTTSIANNIIAGVTTLNLSSSVVGMANNIINDSAFIFTNQFYSSSLGLGTVALNRNNIGGQTNSITISGSLPSGTTTGNSISDNFIFGGSNTIYIDVANARVSGSTAYINVIRTGLMGNNLIVSGSSLLADLSSFGSVFVGRYNANDNIRNKTSDIVFAVGTGNTTTRKTGFLIDSGSNTFVEGTLNVSGSTSLTGSLYIQSGSWIPSATGSSLLTWNSATGQIGQSSVATLISSSFSVGAFNSTITQSGSSNVSQSMTFNNTDISNGVSIVSNSQITLANNGTYNIQFSAQVLAGTGADTIWIWLKKNGTNVSNTATKLVLANNEANVAAWNFVVPAVATDYFELVWQNLNGHATLLTETASGNYPAIPSVILTVTQVE
jgi:hypothetical protein